MTRVLSEVRTLRLGTWAEEPVLMRFKGAVKGDQSLATGKLPYTGRSWRMFHVWETAPRVVALVSLTVPLS